MANPPDSISILHVDDDESFADLAQALFDQVAPDFRVESVQSVEAGLDRLDGTVDCIVSDHDLPRRTGIEFLDAVRAEYPELPFILFTGKGSEEIASEAISAGVTDYLQKDSTLDQFEILANRIRNAVERALAEAEADRQRHRLEQLLKTVPACVVHIDRDGQFVYANDRAEEVLGLEESAVTDRTYNAPEWAIRDLDGEPIPDEDLPFRRVIETGEPIYGFRHSIEAGDGSRRFLSVNGAPIFDADGTVESTVFALTDITDRIAQQERLEAQSERFRQVTEHIGEVVWLSDPNPDEILYVNPAYEAIWGRPREALYEDQSTFIETVHPEDRDRVLEAIDQRIDAPVTTEYRVVRPDGSIRWVRDRAVPVEDESGATKRVVGVATDITELRERQEELTFFRHLVESVGVGVAASNDEGVFTYVNEAYASILGADRDILEGSAIWELNPEYDRASFLKYWRDFADGETRIAETVHEHDGVRRPVQTITTRLSVDGEPLYVGTIQDIAERKARERELARYEQIVEQSREAIWMLDADGRLTFVNQRFIDLASLPEADLLGARHPALIEGQVSSADLAAYEEAIQSLVAGDREAVRGQLPMELGTDTRSFDYRLVRFHPADGGAPGAIGIARDITEQKAYESRVERQNARLSEFASLISHDIRNPLNIVDGTLELIETDDDEHVERCRRAIDRMEELIDDLLTLARRGETVGDTTPVSLAAIASGCWEHVDTASATVAVESEAIILADEGRLRELLENLFRNAVEHGGEAVTVTVGDLPNGFYVADDGPGVPAEDRDRIFREGVTTTDAGTGLGLTIVSAIADGHGWSIEVTESADGGARFEFTDVESP